MMLDLYDDGTRRARLARWSDTGHPPRELMIVITGCASSAEVQRIAAVAQARMPRYPGMRVARVRAMLDKASAQVVEKARAKRRGGA